MSTLTPMLRFPKYSGEWKPEKIGDLLKIGSGRDYKHLQKGDIPVYGTGGLMRYVNDYLYDGKSTCIGRKGTIDKPQFLNGKFWTVDTLFYTYDYRNSVPEFLYLIFQKINWLEHNEASGIPSLSKTTIEKIKVNIPNAAEQQKIADFLTAVDGKIESIDKKVELLKQYKKSVMQKIFSQQIRFTDKNGNTYADWIPKKLDYILSIKKGEQLNRDTLDNYGTYPVINGGTTASGYAGNYNTNQNTITISEGGNSCGYVNYIKTKFWSGGHCYVVEPKTHFDNQYTYYLLKRNEEEIKRLRVGSGLPNIQKSDMLKFTVNISIDSVEQTKISDFLTALDDEINLREHELDQAKQFKKALLQRMFV